MRIGFLLTVLAIAGSAQAADTSGSTVQRVHVSGAPVGEPMAWRYSVLRTAETVFAKHASTQAPGATLAFRLPNVASAQDDDRVEIVMAGQRLPLPMVAPLAFTLPHDVAAADSGAMVVVNRDFPKGSFRHPEVQVRSPGLPEGVRRMGDLRLACAAQIAMLKAESLKFRAVFATVGLFGGDACKDTDVTDIDDPAGPYDTVTIEDGERRLTLSRDQEGMPRLGETAWSDNARIRYTLNDRIVH